MSKNFKNILNYSIIVILFCNNIILAIAYCKLTKTYSPDHSELRYETTILRYKLKKVEEEFILCNKLEGECIYSCDSLYDRTDKTLEISNIIRAGDYLLIIPFNVCLSCIDNILIKINNLAHLQEQIKIIAPIQEKSTMYAYARRANLQNSLYFCKKPLTETLDINKHEFPILCKIGEDGYIKSAISYNNDNSNVIKQFISNSHK